ncbi:UV radiation resistance-associated protein [Colletotrichum higginsianum]|uniref:Autophagy-related protein 14 n=2 Tax=Colletotrichum higginsianum TaxID=80884 RepID=H1VNK1_COLHI|nr:UV radiation resistance-associated protein [Colletotrichum higginsianum IMI 349063]OBR09736.1 UV radiation resistance-associated protein [Colletotrichum higginsianum IMI 349063]TID07155.1 UV radiation resistance associated protein [Colletotrichum higginsianum]CCF41805.1 UV radiation resistance-associated protein [Colletotrichum higginsianum]
MPPPESRPLLLPQNRKLRHLRGIYIRNLSFVRPRGQTIDDTALNKSSSKLDALRDAPQLHHALSSDSLRPKPPRRRSTALAHATPVTRQRMLQFTIDGRAADAFFSLHCDGEDEPVYISETKEHATNFNFQFFDLSHHGPSVTRSPVVTIKIWANRTSWTLLLQDTIDLRSLHFIGTLQSRNFPPNGLIFHLADGIYSLDVLGKPTHAKDLPPLHTSSYNALMKLATLDTSIQDAIATQEQLTAQINDILEKSPHNETPAAEEKVKLAKKYVAHELRSLKAAEKRRDELRESLKSRREAIAQGRALQDKLAKDIVDATQHLAASKAVLAKTKEQIRGQRRRICADLGNIYQITPCPSGPPLSFQIAGLALPNTTYDMATSRGPDDDLLSGALGHVAALTNALQYYLSVPLPYPVTPFGSRSSIRDDISLLTDLNSAQAARQRDFPLYLPRGGSTAAQYRFDYGWFILNKDIEALCASQGLKVVDIRHTLPNLKYLLYVCSAGSDEVPERKRGGVRGLWAGRLKGRIPSSAVIASDGDTSSVGGSRRGSTDSEVLSRQRDELRKAMTVRDGAESPIDHSHNGTGNGNGNGGFAGLPFDEVKVSLRTKGMRENAGK